MTEASAGGGRTCRRWIAVVALCAIAFAAAAKPASDVVEPNAYEQYPSAPSSWDHAVNGYLSVYGRESTRASACSAAIASQTKWIARDEANGYATASERTGCICGSYSNMGNMSFPEPQWVCGAYHGQEARHGVQVMRLRMLPADRVSNPAASRLRRGCSKPRSLALIAAVKRGP